MNVGFKKYIKKYIKIYKKKGKKYNNKEAESRIRNKKVGTIKHLHIE